ncbi:hypothetical protein P3T76_014405 [Phytophthora citrophthora]|uniref:CCHC-type domain-containing protein n=2 Tax=Phytophthora citrophthora TaxID=4793 RepID=A0AAD9LC66_9STRA|nr:hypothetical protein P3T76_014405 [Phytophthora citrophthora]
MSTCTATVTASTKAARTTRSKKPNPRDVEEKAEDNDTGDDVEAPSRGAELEVVREAKERTRNRAVESFSDAATESLEAQTNEGLTDAELETFAKMVQRLETALSRSNAVNGDSMPGGMRELAEGLQKLTTQVANRFPDENDDAAERPQAEQQFVEPAEPMEVEENAAQILEVPMEPQRYEEQDAREHDQQHIEPRGVRQRVCEPWRDECRCGDVDGQHSQSRPRERVAHRNEYRRREDSGRGSRSQRRERGNGCRRSPADRHERREPRRQRSRSPPRRLARGGPPPDDNDSSDNSDSDSDHGRPHGNDIDGSDDNSEGESSSDSSNHSDDDRRRHPKLRQRGRRHEHQERPRARERRGRHDRNKRRAHRRSEERGGRHKRRAKNIKDLELPSFTPTPRASVSTWVDRIDLALKGARESGRGEWSDRSLYFILGNKLMESAARWWVNMDRRLHRKDRTWTKLKVALLRRYGPRVDKSAAEARVNARYRFKDEPYADFAAGLREAADRNEVSERVFLAQFYRCIDRTLRQLVKQPPRPVTLEEAVEKAIEIDDPMDYAVPTMLGVNQPAHPDPAVSTIATEEKRMVIIPGVGTLTIPIEKPVETVDENAVMKQVSDAMAVCNNQQGVYNVPAGVYEFPPGKSWNGRYWAVKQKPEKKKAKPKFKPDATKPRTRKLEKRAMVDSSSEEEKEVVPKRPKTTMTTAAVKRAAADESHYGTTRIVEVRHQTAGERERQPPGPCFHCGQEGHWSSQCTYEPRCFACRKRGHFARDCTDEEAKKRNDEYLRKRAEALQKPAGNESRA